MTLFGIGLMLILVLGLIASPLLQPSYGATTTFRASENNNNSSNIFSYHFGILGFTEDIGEDNFLSCVNMDSHVKTDTIEINKDPLLNIDGIENNFFIILGEPDSDSYHYLQVALPENNGRPSFIVDVRKQPNQPITGALYQMDGSHLAFVFESDSQNSRIDKHYKKYLAGNSKAIVAPSERLGPGIYDFHVVLFQSDRPNGINKDRCAISLNWEFSVDDDGMILTKPPQTKVGKIGVVTEEFSPLKQHQMGMEYSQIKCKTGYRLIEQEGSDDKRIACVTPETKMKLIERGWTKNDSTILPNSDSTNNNNNQKLIEFLENGQVSEFNNMKETMDLSRIQVSLEGADLHGIDLREINLERVHIEYANLKDANLQGIILDYRNIQYTNLQGANLSNVDISDAYLYGVNLQDANLTGAKMKNTHINDSNLDYANLQDADLRGVNFQAVSLIGTDFQDANLQGALMAETNLEKLNFDGANMQFVKLKYASLHNTSLQNTNLQNANLDNANLRGANLSGADLQGANLDNAVLLDANLSNVQNLPISKEEAIQRGAITS